MATLNIINVSSFDWYLAYEPVWVNGPLKPTDHEGQQAHHNHNDFIGQFDLSC
ncbi:hypothetical protein GWP85_01480 [Acinetobacter beijerinckii]|uniref:hypothetical protein n=1 Tax=Acinetobacter beijerinckii TaxID=262668 RepID=UPI0023DD8BA7|nr:hypothetical protein [Acinetobacter beijerinckii]MDF2416181.1 hypothetical protein [Acinetobacter beijerinckii]